MLGSHAAVATAAVKDLPAAKQFYGETLGLQVVHEEGEEAVSYRTGSSTLVVYRSQYAGTNKATSVTWNMPAGDVVALVKELEGKGVHFERYDLPGLTLDGSVHVAGDHRMAWFKDPDGNIHALIS